MIEVARIVNGQSDLYCYRATLDLALADTLVRLLDFTRKKSVFSNWDPLIVTPFLYRPPVLTRFNFGFQKRAMFYAALSMQTIFYEFAFQFMKQRVHLKANNEVGARFLFLVNADDSGALHVTANNIDELMNKKNYVASQQFAEQHPKVTFFKYPSIRDPDRGECVAITDIRLLAKQPRTVAGFEYFYDYEKRKLVWLERGEVVRWDEF